jgi:NADPH-dependent curcumin reductase CurA
MSRNTVVRFVKRPQGFVDESSFAIEPAPMPQPADGQVVLRNFYHSLDPYMRPRMTEMDSYIAPFEVGQVMEGGGIGVVVESRHADYRPGDVVRGVLQWAEYQATTPTAFMRTLEPGRAAWKDYLRVGLGLAHGVRRPEADWRAEGRRDVVRVRRVGRRGVDCDADRTDSRLPRRGFSGQ